MAINSEERKIIVDCLKHATGIIHQKIEELDELISETERNILFERITKIDNLIFKIEKP